ncbi:hypothetical protein [Kineothrix sp. MB12-C1]|uniref:hypothetical protein n=1 Tax=Kineothrix sp. MB12-C1 TaxID=3070215 RepID=UPI0027D27D2F|nr:hypothetical protein [Kineothrix sp. MB12-C1]WMC91803.1 hypothetical protein RBB56_13135 [Kineothrix sp. MB12-C1]
MTLGGKKVMPVIWLIIGALMAEVFLCNFSSWKSLYYREEIIFSSEEMVVEGGELLEKGIGEYIVREGVLQMRLPQIDRELYNLSIAAEFSEDAAIPYTLWLTDEGNHYFYSLPENYLVPGISRTSFTNLYPSGKVREIIVQLDVVPGSVVKVGEIRANTYIPFSFHPERLLFFFGISLLFYLLRNTSIKIEGKVKQVVMVSIVVLLIGMAFRLTNVNPVARISPWPHHKQYQELAEAMAKGQLFLDIEPSEELRNVSNPYDTIYLQANRIDYRADYAYYEGKYYVYFGVVPELMFYLPFYLLTGHHLPNYFVVFLYYSGFIASVFVLYGEVIKRWFSKIPFAIYLLLSTMTVMCGTYLTVIIRPDLYHAPIIAATMFTVGGLWLWIKGKYAEEKRKKIYFLLGSLSMALVAGCRPQMLLFSILAVPLFWEEVIKKRELFSRRSLWNTVCICIPYVVIAIGIMYYNGARFSSPFDFGATYSLTSNDMTRRSFQLQQTFLGLWHYFLQPPFIGSDFPYLLGNQITSASYMGKLNAEYTYGGLLACNVFTWVLFVLFTKKGRMELKRKGIYGIVLTSIAISLMIGIVDVTGAGILQRYMVDMIWGMWFAAVLVMLLFIEKAEGGAYYRMLMGVIVVVFLLQAAYGFGVVFGGGDLSVNVRRTNPELYYRVKELFVF